MIREKKRTMRRIVQIIPAEGWYAVVARRRASGEPLLEQQPLACWALIEDEDEEGCWRDVVGLTADGDVEECYLRERFVGYLREGEPIEKWRAKAERLFSSEVGLRSLSVTVPGD